MVQGVKSLGAFGKNIGGSLTRGGDQDGKLPNESPAEKGGLWERRAVPP